MRVQFVCKSVQNEARLRALVFSAAIGCGGLRQVAAEALRAVCIARHTQRSAHLHEIKEHCHIPCWPPSWPKIFDFCAGCVWDTGAFSRIVDALPIFSGVLFLGPVQYRECLAMYLRRGAPVNNDNEVKQIQFSRAVAHFKSFIHSFMHACMSLSTCLEITKVQASAMTHTYASRAQCDLLSAN